MRRFDLGLGSSRAGAARVGKGVGEWWFIPFRAANVDSCARWIRSEQRRNPTWARVRRGEGDATVAGPTDAGPHLSVTGHERVAALLATQAQELTCGPCWSTAAVATAAVDGLGHGWPAAARARAKKEPAAGWASSRSRPKAKRKRKRRKRFYLFPIKTLSGDFHKLGLNSRLNTLKANK